MKKWFLAPPCAALANTAWAQNGLPLVPSQPLPSGVQPEVIPQPQPPPTSPAAGNVGVSGGCNVGCCNQRTKTVCMAEPSVKLKVSIKYCSEDTHKCYRTCFWPFGGSGCDQCNQGCDQCKSGICNRNTDGPSCGHPWPKRYLIKRIVTEEIQTTKCTPTQVPDCGHGLFSHASGEWQYPPAQSYPVQPGVVPPEAIPSPMPPETIPLPPSKK